MTAQPQQQSSTFSHLFGAIVHSPRRVGRVALHPRRPTRAGPQPDPGDRLAIPVGYYPFQSGSDLTGIAKRSGSR